MFIYHGDQAQIEWQRVMIPSSQTIDQGEYRRTLGVFPTGVTVVTARAPSGGFAGLTVNSFSSLSLEPPLILWSITHASPSRLVFEAASHFAVNVLTEEQAALSRRFATPNPNKFAGVDINLGHGGAPLIAGCAATLECRSYSRQRAGDHWLLLGQVERFTRGPGKPLIFCMGRYWRGGEPLDPV